MKKICLVSIVKDEEHIIETMLNNMNQFVDEFIIVDTGSTDKTKEIIKKFFEEKKVKGKLYEREWKNFGHNKTEALQIAEKESESDYLLFMDADNTIEGNPIFPEDMDKDLYYLKQSYSNETNYFWRQQLFKKGLDWSYKGVLHEYPDSDNFKTEGRIEGNYYCKETHQGSRNKNLKAKYEKDAMILLDGLQEEPNNERYMYYLGQTYNCLNQFKLAADWFLKCAETTLWDEERYHSLYLAGEALLKIGEEKKGRYYLLKAWRFRPTRIESMHKLMRDYRNKEQPLEAYQTGMLIKDIPENKEDILFVEQETYNWRVHDEMTLICHELGFIEEGREHFKKMKKVPEKEKERIENNKKFF